MPLIRFDLIKGRSEKEIADLLDAAHEAMLQAFRVPVRDRYQIVVEHDKSRLRIEDTGLGIERTDKVVIVQVTSRRRTTAEKQDFYRLLCEALQKRCGIAPSDVMVSIVENTDADWSFGNGEAQFSPESSAGDKNKPTARAGRSVGSRYRTRSMNLL